MNRNLINQRYSFAQKIARAAGEVTLEYFQTGTYNVEFKADRSPVTEADRAAETLLRQMIGNEFPDDSIIGEEFDNLEGASGFRWMLDPIDGTKSFISGVPLFGTMVGVDYNGDTQIGVLFFPGLNEIIYAANGQGAWWSQRGSQARQAQVRDRSNIEDCIFVVSESNTFSKRNAAEAYRQLEAEAYVTRTWGDAYGYYLVATGRVDIMVDPILSIWDAAAVKPIIEEAGGSFTDWRGTPSIDSGDAIGTNKNLLPKVLEITRPFCNKVQD